MLYVLQHVLQVAPSLASESQDIISVVVGAIISASVFSAIVTGVIQFLINRRNSNVQERKNDVDEESDLVNRYKEAAIEERSQKESAVRTIQHLLDMADKQVVSLRETVATLNQLIITLTKSADTQKEIIDSLTRERDRSVNDLREAMEQIDEQRTQLVRYKLGTSTGPITTPEQTDPATHSEIS